MQGDNDDEELMDEELFLDEARLQQLEFERKRDGALVEAASGVFSRQDGMRILETILKRSGFGRFIGADPVSVDRHNEALYWLRMLARARPEIARSVMLKCLLAD